MYLSACLQGWERKGFSCHLCDLCICHSCQPSINLDAKCVPNDTTGLLQIRSLSMIKARFFFSPLGFTWLSHLQPHPVNMRKECTMTKGEGSNSTIRWSGCSKTIPGLCFVTIPFDCAFGLQVSCCYCCFLFLPTQNICSIFQFK